VSQHPPVVSQHPPVVSQHPPEKEAETRRLVEYAVEMSVHKGVH
jgi:hypothetical protein